MEQAAFLPGAGGTVSRPPKSSVGSITKGRSCISWKLEFVFFRLVRQNLFMWKDTKNQDFIHLFIYSL